MKMHARNNLNKMGILCQEFPKQREVPYIEKLKQHENLCWNILNNKNCYVRYHLNRTQLCICTYRSDAFFNAFRSPRNH
jgi:hypothetical protein